MLYCLWSEKIHILLYCIKGDFECIFIIILSNTRLSMEFRDTYFSTMY